MRSRLLGLLSCLWALAPSGAGAQPVAGTLYNPGTDEAELERLPGLASASSVEPPAAAVEQPKPPPAAAPTAHQGSSEPEATEASPSLAVSMRLLAQRSSPVPSAPFESRVRVRPVVAAGWFEVMGEADLLSGSLGAPAAQGTARPAFLPWKLRQLGGGYASERASLRAGQLAWTWGLGLVTSAGEAGPRAGESFGEARFGDLAYRVEAGWRAPLPQGHVEVGAGAEAVAEDDDVEAGSTDRAARATLTLRYRLAPARELGLYAAFRRDWAGGSAAVDSWLADVAGRWDWELSEGARLEAAFEAASVVGRSVGALGRLSFTAGRLTAHLDAGYASSGFRADRDLHAGVVLFQESSGAPYGAIEGASWLFPRAAWTARPGVTLYGGPLLATSNGTATRARGFLGTELCAGLRAQGQPLPQLSLEGTLEGGVLLPGSGAPPASAARIGVLARL